jgi:hypothetical protein
MTDPQAQLADENDSKREDVAVEPPTKGEESAAAAGPEKPADAATEQSPVEKPADAATEQSPVEEDEEEAQDASGAPEPAPTVSDRQTGALKTAGENVSKKSVLLGFAGGAVTAVAVLALTGYVWPGFLAGPGKPDDKVAEVTAAMGSRNPAELDKVTCHAPDGKPTSHMLPPQAMQLIQKVTQTAPARLSLDTEAMVPVDLTLSAQGQTQKLPVNLVLTVSNGHWCMNGLAQQQQPS